MDASLEHPQEVTLTASERHPLSRLELLLLAAIICLAGVLRLWQLSTHSLLVDEAFVALGARDIAYNHTPMWDAVSNAPWVWGLAQLFLLFTSDSEFVIRLPTALAGVLAVYLTYSLARQWFGVRVALLSSALLAIHPFAVAHNRVAFVDSLQVAAFLSMMLLVERYREKKGVAALVLIGIAAGFAFLFKYNAVVMIACWLTAGFIAQRFRLKELLVYALVTFTGCLLVIALWPYNQLVWLMAFGAKGGGYDMSNSFGFFATHAREPFMSTAMIVLPVSVGVMLRSVTPWRERAALTQLLLFVSVYLIAIVVLGRSFSRYLLVLTPFVSILIALVAVNLWNLFRKSARTPRLLSGVALAIMCVLLGFATQRMYSGYLGYLHNDVDERQIASEVRQLMQNDSLRLYTWADESIVAYYLGLTQYRSRDTRGALDHGITDRLYSNGLGIPFSHDTYPDPVLTARRVFEQRGLLYAATHTRDLSQEIKDSVANLKKSLAELRAGSPARFAESLHSGDIAVAYGGVRHAAGEPFLVSLETSEFQPPRNSLPLEQFTVWKSFRPEGVPTVHDTDLTDFKRAGAWILIKK